MKGKKRAAFFRNALEVLTDRMDPEALQRLMESNACCKSGAREKASKAFARENAAPSLAENFAAPDISNTTMKSCWA